MTNPLDHPLSSPIAEGRTAEVYDWHDGHILKLYHTWCPPHARQSGTNVAEKLDYCAYILFAAERSLKHCRC